MLQLAKFRFDWSSCCWWDMVIFLFFSIMAAVRLRGFVIRVWTTDKEYLLAAGVCHCTNIGWIRCSSLTVCKFYWPAVRVRFEMRFHALIIGGYREQYQRDPKKAFLCAKTHHVTYTSLKSAHWCGLDAINSDSPCFSMGRTAPKCLFPLVDLHRI